MNLYSYVKDGDIAIVMAYDSIEGARLLGEELLIIVNPKDLVVLDGNVNVLQHGMICYDCKKPNRNCIVYRGYLLCQRCIDLNMLMTWESK